MNNVKTKLINVKNFTVFVFFVLKNSGRKYLLARKVRNKEFDVILKYK